MELNRIIVIGAELIGIVSFERFELTTAKM